ncbi:c-type cytochrome [Limnohabitans sp. T6-20]|uniref:c-type cytochrome n=1 Tax=Limnohabitans sp. T6-20 TaxID=1100725 RepID=UPI000D3BDCF3|nr:c-type cytochrome [Limnohabitans sp. T6-20]PUE13047.1 hypothetical protein B9Z33_06125 [Limnohabitans sp. T6-20]
MKKTGWVLLALSLGIYGCSTCQQQPAMKSEAALKIAKQNNCLACHGVDRPIVGPAFKDVALRYRGQDVQQQLVRKVKYGGSTVWGVIPQPPMMQIPDEDLKQLIRWITALDSDQNQSRQELR